MSRSRRIAWIAACVAVCLAAAGAVWKWRESSAFFDTRALLSRFPAEDGTVVRVDFALLRKAGLLGEAKAPLEPEYQEFVQGTGFNYRTDLNLLIASASAGGTYFIAGGRFDWDKLKAYAARHGGSCFENLCRAEGSVPERHISFLKLRSDAIALAVAKDDLAVARLANQGTPVTGVIPEGPAWISVPGAWLRQGGFVPAGLKVALSGLLHADRVVVRIAGGQGGSNPEALLEATCRTARDADLLTSQLRLAAEGLKGGTDELGKALAAGVFSVSGSTVTGRWPVRREMLETLTAGI